MNLKEQAERLYLQLLQQPTHIGMLCVMYTHTSPLHTITTYALPGRDPYMGSMQMFVCMVHMVLNSCNTWNDLFLTPLILLTLQHCDLWLLILCGLEY